MERERVVFIDVYCKQGIDIFLAPSLYYLSYAPKTTHPTLLWNHHPICFNDLNNTPLPGISMRLVFRQASIDMRTALVYTSLWHTIGEKKFQNYTNKSITRWDTFKSHPFRRNHSLASKLTLRRFHDSTLQRKQSNLLLTRITGIPTVAIVEPVTKFKSSQRALTDVFRTTSGTDNRTNTSSQVSRNAFKAQQRLVPFGRWALSSTRSFSLRNQSLTFKTAVTTSWHWSRRYTHVRSSLFRYGFIVTWLVLVKNPVMYRLHES